jgi:hypothetical protein
MDNSLPGIKKKHQDLAQNFLYVYLDISHHICFLVLRRVETKIFIHAFSQKYIFAFYENLLTKLTKMTTIFTRSSVNVFEKIENASQTIFMKCGPLLIDRSKLPYSTAADLCYRPANNIINVIIRPDDNSKWKWIGFHSARWYYQFYDPPNDHTK